MIQLARYVRRRRKAALIKKNGFWFVDIPRTSSSSIRVDLSKRFGSCYGKANLIQSQYQSDNAFRGHIPARAMRNVLGKRAWQRIFTFTLVRNPWDRVFSMYGYRRRIGKIPFDLSFRDYVLELQETRGAAGGRFELPIFYYGSWDYVVDEQGEIIVDYIGRYETRQKDLQEIARRIDCPDLGSAFLQRSGNHVAHYASNYDDETRDIVGRLYRNDVDLFGYEFETVPPRSGDP